ncbi:SWR1-complex protein 4 [Smittium culicis]|uniref:SWR1-complex protein 4 n=1 Tax=Smittium culicis TaxID=133412 RepID=A0A1R1YTV7_9FUNG|nr:SWR1-complex protein 4 [Smittium culicis]
MNSKDLRQVMNFVSKSQDQPQYDDSHKHTFAKEKNPKKPPGMNRELFNLFDHDKLDIPISLPIIKPMPKLPSKSSKWILKNSTSTARKDQMSFRHWSKDSEYDTDYHFSKYNAIINIPTFTKEDYDTYLSDPDWSYDETIYLFQLCKDFDLRFILIHDRYAYLRKLNSTLHQPPTPSLEHKPLLGNLHSETPTKATTSTDTPAAATITTAADTSPKASSETDTATVTAAADNLSAPESSTLETSTESSGLASKEPEIPTDDSTKSKIADIESKIIDIENKIIGIEADIIDNTQNKINNSENKSDNSSLAISDNSAEIKADSLNDLANDAKTISDLCVNNKKSRSIEDLKDRYYSISKKMVEVPALRKKYNFMGLDQSSSSQKRALSLLSYNKPREEKRKKLLIELFNRSDDQIKEEQMLLIELDRIISQQQQISKLREYNMQLLVPFEETVPSISSVEPNAPEIINEIFFSSISATKKKLSISKESTTDKKGTQDANKKPSSQTKFKDQHLKITRLNKDPSSLITTNYELVDIPNYAYPAQIPKRDMKLGPGAFLRSEKISNIGKLKNEQMQLILDHLGVSCANSLWPRPFMPTSGVCDRFDTVQSLILQLLELKKLCDKTEAELATYRKH